MKKFTAIATLAAGGMILGTLLAPAASAERPQVAGAAGLIPVVAQVALDDTDIRVIDSSFNNLDALNNVLNNSPILNNNDVDVNVLTFEDALNNLDLDIEVIDDVVVTVNDVPVNVNVEDIVAIVQVLGGGVLVLT